MLALIWFISLGLSAASIIVMLTLVLRRAVTERRRGDDTSQRQALQRALIHFTQDEDRTRLDTALGLAPMSSSSRRASSFCR